MSNGTLIPVPTTPDEFRAVAPAFQDSTIYPDAEIQFWLDAAQLMLNSCVWGTLIGAGTIAFVSYNLAIYAQFMQQSNSGQIPGVLRGPVTMEQAGSLAVSYDASLTAMKDGGPFNLNAYGQRFLWMARVVGTRPFQLNVPPWGGVCACPVDYSALSMVGLAGRVGPGWHNDANVPVGKFIPPSGPAPLLP